MSKTYSAGIVTAYGAAKRAGYQGTYEDFCRQQAGYAANAQTVEQAKNTAVSAANTATTRAGEATTAATAAQTAKTQTEQAASQALTDISTARSGAISAVQTEGQTQTANARAQAQAAAQSANTASTKASGASASATSAGQSATNAAASATSAANAASAAQGVLESIPSDYSQMSADVTQLKADLSALDETTVQAKRYIPQSVEITTGKAYNTKTGELESLGGNFVCAEFQVTNGEQLKISGWGIADNYRPRFWSESAIISAPTITGDDNGYFYDDVMTVPNGATRLLINGRIGGIVISKYGTNSATEQYTSAVISEARNNVVTFDEIIPQTLSLNSRQYVDTSTGVASSLYGFTYVDFPVTAGDILLLSGYGNTASNAPAFWSASAIVKATGIVGDEENRFTDVRVVVPNGATRLLINGRPSFNINIAIKKVVNEDKSKRFFEEYDIAVEELSMARFNIKNLERRALNAEKANDFAWGTFDHPYFVFVHDDTNSFLPTAYSAFHAKGKPLGCATIVSRLENEYDNQTAKEWLDLVVADGGEVLTHWDYDLLSTSTDEEWYTHFVLPKRILEENGYDVRGAILANASHSYTAKGQSYCRKYYDYADKVGTTTQYRLGRTLMSNFADLSAFKSQLDIELQSNGLYAYGFHGLRQDESWITEQNLKEIIDYIVSGGGIISTYSDVFDTVGSTVLEQRIVVLENTN